MQRYSPVGAYIRPVPGTTSGYGDEVIFADGTFIEGSTLELSADGPLRHPFVAFSQVSSCLLADCTPCLISYCATLCGCLGMYTLVSLGDCLGGVIKER